MSLNNNIVEWLDKRFYAQYSDRWDDKLFREEILKMKNKKELVILDIGAGSGIIEYMNFKGCFKKVVGVDPDERVLNNPYLDQAYVGYVENMNFFSDKSFDAVILNNVLEHITEPSLLFSEISRILKPGGLFLAKTPNKRHYVPLIARITPLWFHKHFNRLRGINDEDTFPTQYLLNTKKAQIKFVKEHNFKITSLKTVEGRPEYLRFFFVAYFFGIFYERIVNKLQLHDYKVLMITKLMKEAQLP